MKLKRQTIEELKEIMARDYKANLSEEELISLGSAMLRLTRLATTALARADERIARLGKRDDSLEPNTSKE